MMLPRLKNIRSLLISQKRTVTIIVIITIVNMILRLYALGIIPQGIVNDEAGYIYSAYSIWKTGRDPTGAILPLSITLDNSFSPVYIYIMAPFVGILGLNATSGRLPFALMGIATGLLFYLFMRKVTKNNSIAVISYALLTLSPWQIHLSRGSWDVTCAMFFYMLGFVIYLTYIKSTKILWSMVPFTLGFYSYHATKIYFIMIIPMLLYHLYVSDRLHKKKLVIVFVSFCVIVLSYFLVFHKTTNTRENVLIWNNMEDISKFVGFERYTSSSPSFMKPVFNNKILTIYRQIREKYLEFFSPQFLFLYGETSGLSTTYTLHFRGELYVFEMFFLFVGIVALWKHRTRDTMVFIAIPLLLSPIPSVISDDKTYVMRSAMALFPLYGIIAYGISECVYQGKYIHRFIKPAIVVIIVTLLYVSHVSSYLYQYYFRYPIYGAEGWFQSSYDLAKRIESLEKQQQQIIVAGAGEMFLMQLGVHNHIEPSIIQAAWNMPYPKSVGKYLTLIELCPGAYDKVKRPVHFFARAICTPDIVETSSIKDRGELLHVVWKEYDLKEGKN